MSGDAPRVVAFLDRHLEEAVAGFLMCGLTMLIFFQVVMRYVFRAPVSWSDELAVYCMVGLVYFGAAYAVRERAHIRVFGALLMLPRRVGISLAILADIIWFVFNLVMCWQSWLLVESFSEQPYFSAALQIDQRWPYLLVPTGFLLMALRMVQLYVGWLRGGKPSFELNATS